MPIHKLVLPPGVDPIRAATSGEVFDYMPDIIEFTVSDRFLKQEWLYPRQATLLKTIFLRDDLFTQFDYDTLYEWTQGFHLRDTPDENGWRMYEGYHGIVPDILERITFLKANGYKWFTEVVAAIGRRGGKGWLGGICGAYVLWNHLSVSDPKRKYGIPRAHQITAQVFGAKKELAKALQWKDLTDTIIEAPCFQGFISRTMSDFLSLHAMSDFGLIEERNIRGIATKPEDIETFEIQAKESTKTSGRGFSSFMQFYDEMAHVDKSTARASADEVYSQATPALRQFKKEAFIYEGSSTMGMIGQFYENYCKALRVNEQGDALHPNVLTVQLESWDMYAKREVAPYTRMRNGWKRTFPPLPDSPPIEWDEEMQRLEMANPETFAIEYRSHWATSLSAYLNPERIKAMWLPWPEGRELTQQPHGRLDRNYSAHCDPSSVGANFGIALAHTEGPDDERGMLHVIFDKIHHFSPGDFDYNNFQMDYAKIEEWLCNEIIDPFMPTTLTFDQFNSVYIMQNLRKFVQSKPRPRSTNIFEVTATKQLNWKIAETFKYALGMGLIHGPLYHLAEQEMLFLQDVGHERVDHPTEGPVQTKDVWDAMANVVYALIGEQMAAYLGKEFEAFGVTGAWDSNIKPFGPEMGTQDEEVIRQFRTFGSGRQTPQDTRRDPARGGLTRQTPGRYHPSRPWSR